MKLCIAGSRTIRLSGNEVREYVREFLAMRNLPGFKTSIKEVVCGLANGADSSGWESGKLQNN